MLALAEVAYLDSESGVPRELMPAAPWRTRSSTTTRRKISRHGSWGTGRDPQRAPCRTRPGATDRSAVVQADALREAASRRRFADPVWYGERHSDQAVPGRRSVAAGSEIDLFQDSRSTQLVRQAQRGATHKQPACRTALQARRRRPSRRRSHAGFLGRPGFNGVKASRPARNCPSVRAASACSPARSSSLFLAGR
jgi:hypothetical protein